MHSIITGIIAAFLILLISFPENNSFSESYWFAETEKDETGTLKDRNGNIMRGTPMVLGKNLKGSVNFAADIKNWELIKENGFHTIQPEILNVVEHYEKELDWDYTTVAYHMYNSNSSNAVKKLMEKHRVICTEWFYHFVSLERPDYTFVKQVDGHKENAQTLEKIGSSWIDWRDWDDTTLNELLDTLITDAKLKNYWWKEE